MNRTNTAMAAACSLAVLLALAGCAPGATPTPSSSTTRNASPTATATSRPGDGPTSTPTTPSTGSPTTAPPTPSAALDAEQAWNTCASVLKSQYGISPLGGYNAADVIPNGSAFDAAIGFDPSTGQGRQSPFVCTIQGTNVTPIVQQTRFGK